jgi:hypothetical protein
MLQLLSVARTGDQATWHVFLCRSKSGYQECTQPAYLSSMQLYTFVDTELHVVP